MRPVRGALDMAEEDVACLPEADGSKRSSFRDVSAAALLNPVGSAKVQEDL